MDLSMVAREEKDSKDLCKRPENFYEEASGQISRMEAEVKHLTGAERDLLEEAILADKRDLKSIKDLRIKKLVKMAVSDAYRDKPIHALDNMLYPEGQFYEMVVSRIKLLRKI